MGRRPPRTARRAAAVLAATLLLPGCGGGTGRDPAARPSAPSPAAPAASAGTPAAPPPVPPALGHLPTRAATVWAVGDGADGSPAARALAARITRARPSLFLYLGDVYEAGTAAEFAQHYAALYGALARRTAPTPGNHDAPQRAEGYDPYWERALGGRIPDFYALHLAGWTVLSLDSEAPHDAASPQLAWLRRQVRRPGDCRIAFWHRPRFSAGLHGDQADVAPLWDALRGHAALILNGHDHTSQRLKAVGGTTEIVAGGGGHRPYPLDVGDRRLAYASTGQPAALELRLRRGRAELAFRRADGHRLDHAEVRCRPAAGT